MEMWCENYENVITRFGEMQMKKIHFTNAEEMSEINQVLGEGNSKNAELQPCYSFELDEK